MNKAAQALGRLGGKAGRGESKRRSTSFSSATAKAALKARWAKHKRSKTKARALRRRDEQPETMNSQVTSANANGVGLRTSEAPFAAADGYAATTI